MKYFKLIMNWTRFKEKFKKLWYLVLIFVVIGSGLSYIEAQKVFYSANIILNLNPLDTENNEYNTEYYKSLSNFLVNVYNNKIIESDIVDRMGKKSNFLGKRNVFYKVKNLDLGFVSVTANFDSNSEAQDFINSIKNTHNISVVKLWNEQKNPKLQVRGLENFQVRIVEYKSDDRYLAFPFIISILASLILIAILPLKTELKKIENE
jgi:acylphosphatase